MISPWLSALAILLLLVLNGFLSMVEIALVLCRESKLKAQPGQDPQAADAALNLVRAPDAALSTIQTLVTLSGVFAGAFAVAGLSGPLAVLFTGSLGPAWAVVLACVVIVIAVATVWLLFGELVPKRVGLAHPDAVIRFAAGSITTLTRLSNPLARLFGRTADGIAVILQLKPTQIDSVSEDDVKLMVREGGRSGALRPEESEMIEAVLGLDRLRVKELMTLRGDIIWLDVTLPTARLFDLMVNSGHTRFPLHEGRRDNVIGFVTIQDAIRARQAGGEIDFRKLAKPPLMVPPTQPALLLLENFRKSGSTFALVSDEFGGISGLITMRDAIEAIIGDFQASPDDVPTVVRRANGSWLVDASLYFDDLLKHFPDFPDEATDDRSYVTLNGFILQRLDHMPQTGETLEADPYRLEVIDLDRNRVDKVLITRKEEEPVPDPE